MTDRELLELAAKAAGIDLYVWGPPGAENFANMASPGCRWNPLTDDGDALRLAVKLRFEVSIEPDWVVVMTECAHDVIERGSDQYAATRRAIVRAAAEIGKDKP